MNKNNSVGITAAALPEIVFRKADHERIADLVDIMPGRLSHVSSLLRQELGRAQVTETPPSDTVQVYSKVSFKLAGLRRTRQVTLVYPHEAAIDEERIPVTSLLGAALIGLKKGATMSWRNRDGMPQTLTVIDILK